MAKKSDFEMDDFNIDDDLGMDFDFDGLDPSNDKRSAVTKFKSSFFDQIKTDVRSTSFFNKILKKALPKDYADILEQIDGANDKAMELYNNSANKLKPSLNAMKRGTAGLLKTNDKYLPKALQDKLKEWADSAEELERRGPTKEEERDSQLSIELGGIFATQIKEDVRQHEENKRRDLWRVAIEGKRHKSNLQALDVIRSGISRLVGYQDAVTVKYQRKMLEIGYRQLFATKDLGEAMVKQSNKQLAALELITKNTGLPDAIKLSTREALGSVVRDKMLKRVQTNMLGGLESLVDRATRRAKETIDQKLDSFGMAVEMAAGFREQVDMGGGAASMGGTLAGGAASDKLAEMLAERIKKMTGGDKRISAGLAKILAGLRNAGGHADNWSRTATTTDYSTWKGMILGELTDLGKALVRSDARPSITIGDGAQSLNDPSALTVHMRRSITDVIPGYLARILREIKVFRTGNENTEMEFFNYSNSKFTSKSGLRKSIKRRLQDQEGVVIRQAANGQEEIKTSTSGYMDEMIAKLDKKGRLSDKAKRALSLQLLDNSVRGTGFIPKDLADPTRYMQSIDQEAAKEAAEFIKRRFKVGVGRKLGKHSSIDYLTRDVSGDVDTLRRNIPSVLDEIQYQLEIGNREYLEEMGLMVRKNHNTSELNMEAVYAFILGNSPTTNNSSNPNSSNNGGNNAQNNGPTPNPGPSGGNAPFHFLNNGGARNYRNIIAGGNSAGSGSTPANILHNNATTTLLNLVPVTQTTGPTVNNQAPTIAEQASSVWNKRAELMARAKAKLKQKGMDISDNARYQMRLMQGQVANDHPEIVNRISGAYNNAKQLTPKMSDETRLQMWLLRSAAADGISNLRTNGAGSVLNLLRTQQSTDSAMSMSGGKFKFNAGPSAFRKNGEAGLNDYVQSELLRIHVVTQEASGEPVTQSSIAKFLNGARKLLSDKLSFTLSNRTSVTQAAETPSVSAEGGLSNAGGEGTGTMLEEIHKRLEEIRDTMQANLHLAANMSGGDGRRFGFRYGIRSGLGKIMSGAGSMGKGILSFYGSGLKLAASGMGMMGRGALALGDRVVGGITLWRDIYVQGEQTPALYARGLREGKYIDVSTGKVIKKLEDIKGAVKDLDGNIVLKIEDFQKGLFTIQGKPVLKNLANKLINFYGAILSPVAMAARLTTKTMSWVHSKLTANKDVYVPGDLRNPRLRAVIMEAGGYFLKHEPTKVVRTFKDISGAVIDRNGNEVLSDAEVQAGICDSRGNKLKTFGDKIWGAGSFLVRGAARIAWGATKAAFKLGMLPVKALLWGASKLTGFFARGLNLSVFENVSLTNSNTTVALLTAIRDILDQRLPGKKKKVNGDVDQDGIRDNSWEDKKRKMAERIKALKDKATNGINGAKAAGAGMLGGLGSRIKGLFGGGDEEEGDGTTIINTGDIGGGRDRSGPIPPSTNAENRPRGRMGRAWDAVKKFGRKIPGAGLVARAAPWLARGAMAAGSMLMGGLSLSGLGAAVSAVVTGAATLLASPIVLGALAVAAVGAAGYFAYKYLTKPGASEFLNLRMAQYGIDPMNEAQAQKIIGLESFMAKYVKLKGAEATLDLDAETVLKAAESFGVPTENEARMDRFTTWLNERFKYVYVYHRACAEKLSPGSLLSDMDAKFTKAQKLEALGLLSKGTQWAPYECMSSPFEEALSGGRNKVVEYTQIAKKNIEALSDKAPVSAMAGGTVAGVGMMGAGYMAVKQKASEDGKALTVDQINNSNKTSGNFGVKGGITATASLAGFTGMSSTPSSLDIIRMKAYGLVEMDIDKVKTLRSMEATLIKRITWDANNNATITGEAEEFLSEFSGIFGLSTSDNARKVDWIVWFNKRFLSVFLAYCTAVRRVDKTMDILTASNTMKPADQVSVANEVIGTKNGTIFTTSIWGYDYSPWSNYELNQDSSTTKVNIDSLQKAVKNKQYSDDLAANQAVALLAKPISSKQSDSMLREEEAPKDNAVSKIISAFTGSSTTTNNGTPIKKEPSIYPTALNSDTSKYSSRDYTMPAEGRLSSVFGPRNAPKQGASTNHKGIDIAAPNGTPVRACADGIIIRRDYSSTYGNVVYIKHPDGKSSRYGHLVSFQAGQSNGYAIKKGEILGYVGSTGISTGNHLHFEIRDGATYDARPLDPLKVISDSKAKEQAKELESITGKEEPPQDSPLVDNSLGLAKAATSVSTALQPKATKTTFDPTPTRAINSFVPEADYEPAVAAREQKVIQTRNVNENAKALANTSALEKILERSYTVQVEMRDELRNLNKRFVEVASNAASNAEISAKAGKRPTETAMRPNPISVKKLSVS